MMTQTKEHDNSTFYDAFGIVKKEYRDDITFYDAVLSPVDINRHKQWLETYLENNLTDGSLKNRVLAELQKQDTLCFDNASYIKYTYRHRIAIQKLCDEILTYPMFTSMYKKVDLREKTRLQAHIAKHDVDKLLMYLFLPKKTVSKLHRLIHAHHINDVEKEHVDFIEMILDWECAYLTKDDKKRNAYDTLHNLHDVPDTMLLSLSTVLAELDMSASYDARVKYNHIFDTLQNTPFHMADVFPDIKNHCHIW